MNWGLSGEVAVAISAETAAFAGKSEFMRNMSSLCGQDHRGHEFNPARYGRFGPMILHHGRKAEVQAVYSNSLPKGQGSTGQDLSHPGCCSGPKDCL